MDPESHARAIIEANRYMALGTANADGPPWASPDWLSTDDAIEFLWVSSPAARHSRNIAARPDVNIVIFESQAPIGGARALYAEAVAAELAGAERDRGNVAFSRPSAAQGATARGREDVVAPARWRLFCAVASARRVLGPGDKRVPVTRAGG